jgi:uncharacterized protein YbjT (DUF2867 family)
MPDHGPWVCETFKGHLKVSSHIIPLLFHSHTKLMPGFRNFALAGLGTVGSHIVRELLKLKNAGKIDNVTILTRSVRSPVVTLQSSPSRTHTCRQDSSNYGDYEASGAKIAVVDYGSTESLKNALTGSDVVITTVGPTALQSQLLLAEQAKAAGVKLFVPSEFGNATDRKDPEGLFLVKQSVHRKLKELDLPYALFFTGPHTDYCFVSYAPSPVPQSPSASTD